MDPNENITMNGIEFLDRLDEQSDTVCFDMDGVLAQFDVKKFIGDDPPFMDPEYHWAWKSKPMRECVQLASLMVRLGWNVHIISHKPYYINMYIQKYGIGRTKIIDRITAEDKIAWAQTHVPKVKLENIHILEVSQQKSEVFEKENGQFIGNGNFVLLDDDNRNLEMWRDSGGIAVKYLNGGNSPESWNGWKLKLW